MIEFVPNMSDAGAERARGHQGHVGHAQATLN